MATVAAPPLIDYDEVAGKSYEELRRLNVDQKVALSLTDPVEFAWNVLQHRLWWRQEELLRALFTHTKIAVKACHASSKTFTAAEAALFWLQRYPDGIVISTAPGERQVEGLLWKEIRNSLGNCLLAFPKPTLKKLEIDEQNYGMGMTTRSDVTAERGVRFSGFHGGRILLIIDEAPGVPQDIWDGIQGIQAGGHVVVLALGNPVVPSGAFYDCFHTKRAGWHTITIDAFETPHLYCDKRGRFLTMHDIADMGSRELAEIPSSVPWGGQLWSPVPNIVSRRWVREMMEELNADPNVPEDQQDPLWQSKVRGQFPKQSEDAVIWLAWIERCAGQPRPDEPEAFLTAGVDPAAGGDNETAVVVVERNHIVDHIGWRKRDPRGECLAFLKKFGRRLREIRVDVDGVGYYFAKHLADELDYAKVIEFHNGAEPKNKKRFVDAKAEGYWNLRELFQGDLVTGKIDNVQTSQLAAIRYDHEPKKGRIRLESKDAMKARGVKSPDHADALMMALAGVSRATSPPTKRMARMMRHTPAVRDI